MKITKDRYNDLKDSLIHAYYSMNTYDKETLMERNFDLASMWSLLFHADDIERKTSTNSIHIRLFHDGLNDSNVDTALKKLSTEFKKRWN